MVEDQDKTDHDDGVFVSKKFLLLVCVGFALIFGGMMVMALSAGIAGGSGSFSGVIFIGPFPIVIGAGPGWTWLAAIGIGIAAVSIIMFVIMRKRG
jgi:uncharacterized membrane protein